MLQHDRDAAADLMSERSSLACENVQQGHQQSSLQRIYHATTDVILFSFSLEPGWVVQLLVLHRSRSQSEKRPCKALGHALAR